MQRPRSSAPLSPSRHAGGGLAVPELLSRAISELQVGERQRVQAILAPGVGQARKRPEWTRAYATLYLAAGDSRLACKWYTFAIEHAPGDAALWAGKGLALHEQGLHREAVAVYDRALELAPGDTHTLYNRAASLQALRDYPGAIAGYRAALSLAPHYGQARLGLAGALLAIGETYSAVAEVDGHLALVPGDPAGLRIYAEALFRLGRHHDALAVFDQYLSVAPSTASVLINRAAVLKELGQLDEALGDLDRALVLVPHEREARLAQANVLLDLGRVQEAEKAYRALAERDPIIHNPAIGQKAEFRVLFLFAPQGGNTPVHDMVSFAPYQHDVLMVLPGVTYRTRELRNRADVVFNLISDPDVSEVALEQAVHLAEQLDRPVLNKPVEILATSRDAVARGLRGIPGCVVPATRKVRRDEISAFSTIVGGHFKWPLIIRGAGLHGGEDMELVADWSAVEQFVAASPAREFYIAEFVDYRSSDGYFRKYRFFFVGDAILPYHLAIGEHWKVHHASTGMHAHPLLQQEEQAFLEQPGGAFGEQAFEALRQVRCKFDLDYFGIDCAVDRNGQVVVFEVNASMLAHLQNETFPYKTPHVQAIKAAFGNLLRTSAAGTRRDELRQKSVR